MHLGALLRALLAYRRRISSFKLVVIVTMFGCKDGSYVIVHF
jgi:hypothetical protein